MFEHLMARNAFARLKRTSENGFLFEGKVRQAVVGITTARWSFVVLRGNAQAVDLLQGRYQLHEGPPSCTGTHCIS